MKTGKRTIYSGIILTVAGILGSIVLATSVGILLTGLIVVGILAMINGAMKARGAKKALARQIQATS